MRGNVGKTQSSRKKAQSSKGKAQVSTMEIQSGMTKT